MEVKFKVINNIKEADLIEARMRILKNNIFQSRAIWLIYSSLVIYMVFHKFIYFKQFYSYSAYPIGYRDVLLAIFVICVGIFIWKLPSIMSKEAKIIDKKHINTEESLCFYETYITRESEFIKDNFNYSLVKRIYETDTKFVFLLNNRRYFFVSKDSFVVGDSNKFRVFLKETLDSKVIKDIL